MRYLSLFLLFTYISCSQPIPPSEELSNIKIARDEWGVPHIMAPTDEEVVYGLAWAECEDDFVTMQEQMLAIRGKLGEVNGLDGVVVDLGVKFMGLRELVEERYEKDLSEDFRKILDGFVAGANNYALLHPEEVLLEDLFPLTGHDIIIGYLLGTVNLSGAGKHLERIMNERIYNDVASNFPRGSNAIAVSRNKTTDGKTYLAINSHQPLEGWYSWYEAHLISEEGWNMLGGTFPGGITIFHGVNEHLGWAHTVNHADFSDVYKLTMHPEKENFYEFDGEWLELEEVLLESWVRIWKLGKFPVKRTLYKSKYGPTFKTDQGFFAWRFVVGQDIRSAEQWYHMNKAKNFEEFMTALNMQGMACTNLVYADREDNIYYLSNGRVPIREEGYNWQEVLPGNTSKTLWTDYYPIDSLPQVLNPPSGFVFNTNNSPFSATAPEDNMPEPKRNETMGYQSKEIENNRSMRFLELIAQYDSLSYEDFKRIKFDRQYPSQMTFPSMVNLELLLNLDPNKYPDIEDAIKRLNQWDRSTQPNNTTAPLYLLSLNNVIASLKEEDRYHRGNTIEEERCVAAIKEAKSFLEQHFGGLEVTLGDFQRHSRGNVNLPIGGGPDILAAIYSSKQDDNTYRAVAGESYIEMVRFSEEGVEIESVHSFGSSAEPDSPHYTDQMELFAQQKMKKMTLNKEEVLKSAKKIYSPFIVRPIDRKNLN